VTITGTGFGPASPTIPPPYPPSPQGARQVVFRGADGGECNATVFPSWASWTDTSIQTYIPTSLTGGPAQVFVSVTVGGVPCRSNSVWLSVTPHIDSISPVRATVGSTVSIHGKGFSHEQGQVFCDGSPDCQAEVLGWSDRLITYRVPDYDTLGIEFYYTVQVASPYGGSNTKHFDTLPTIFSVSPTAGPAGSTIRVNGRYPDWNSWPYDVHFGAVTQTIRTIPPRDIQVPEGISGSVQFWVSNSMGESNRTTFFVQPHIKGLSPSSGAAGSTLVINGTGFDTYENALDGRFRGSVVVGSAGAQVLSWTNTQISVKVPAAASGSTKVTVYNTWGSSNQAPFAVTPMLSSLSATSSAAGATITLTGSGFGSTGKVTFGRWQATCSRWTAGSIKLKVPGGIPKGKPVAVQVVVGGAGSNTIQFTRSR
jgi:hypothetical protein